MISVETINDYERQNSPNTINFKLNFSFKRYAKLAT